jgi:hypothetical protein
MRVIINILILIILVIFFGFAFLHIFINMHGRFLLMDKLKNTFDKEVFVGSVKTRLPFELIINDLEVKDLFKIDEVIAPGGMFDVLGRNFSLFELRIKKATVYLEKPPKAESQDKSQNTAPSQSAATDKNVKLSNAMNNLAPAPLHGLTFQLPNISVKHLVISDSAFNFTDRLVEDKPIKLTLKNVNIEIENLKLPVRGSEITYFELIGKISWQNNADEGKIWFQGWINFFKKDMRAELKIADIDGIWLHPYYSNWVDLEKSHIQNAKLNFFSEILGFNNDVTADCHLELTQIEFKPHAQDQQREKAEKIATAVIDIFRTVNQGKIVLDFKLKTKMDSPEFGLDNIIKVAVEDKILQVRKDERLKSEDILKMPAKVIETTISTATDLTKSVINGTISVGKELKKAVETSFSKEAGKVSKDPVRPDTPETNLTK